MERKWGLTAPRWDPAPARLMGARLRYGWAATSRGYVPVGPPAAQLVEEFLALDMAQLARDASSHHRQRRLAAKQVLEPFFSRWGPVGARAVRQPRGLYGESVEPAEDDLESLADLHDSLRAAADEVVNLEVARRTHGVERPRSRGGPAPLEVGLSELQINLVRTGSGVRLGIVSDSLGPYMYLALAQSLWPEPGSPPLITSCLACGRVIALHPRRVYCSSRCSSRHRQRRLREKRQITRLRQAIRKGE